MTFPTMKMFEDVYAERQMLHTDNERLRADNARLRSLLFRLRNYIAAERTNDRPKDAMLELIDAEIDDDKQAVNI